MEINADNFEVAHDAVEQALRSCEFFSVDLEFTGIDRDEPAATKSVSQDNVAQQQPSSENGASEQVELKARQLSESLLRTPSTQYATKREAIANYSVVQIGISVFQSVSTSTSKLQQQQQLQLAQATSGDSVDVAKRAAVVQYMRQTARSLERVFGSNATATTTHEDKDEGGESGAPEGDLASSLIAYMQTDCEVVASLPHTADVTALLQESLSQFYARMGEWSRQIECSLESLGVADADGAAAAANAACADRVRALTCAQQLTQLYTQWISALPLVQEAAERTLAQRSGKVSTGGKEVVTDDPPLYTVRSFFAYLFPSSLSNVFASTGFDADTLGEFLAKNDMDFNKWVREGLRYTSLPEYYTRRAATVIAAAKQKPDGKRPGESLEGYADCYGSRLNDLLPLSSVEMKYAKFVVGCAMGATRAELRDRTHGMMAYARQVRAGLAAQGGLPPSTFIGDNIANRTEQQLLNALGLRKANRQFEPFVGDATEKDDRLEEGFTDVEGIRGTASARGVPQDRLLLGAQLLSTVVTAAQQWRKPLVLHNGYSDMAFLLQTVYGRLPESYAGFKRLARRTFPVVYDTRTLTCSPALQHLGNTQGHLAKTFREVATAVGAPVPLAWATGQSQRPRFVFNPELAGSVDLEKAGGVHAHHAGYDAFITGCLFAYAREELFLRTAKGKAAPRTRHAAVAPYEGVMPVYGSLFSVNLNTAEADVLVAVPDMPVALYYGNGLHRFMETIREVGRRVAALNVSVRCIGDVYLVTVCNPGVSYDDALHGLRAAAQFIQSEPRRYSYASSITMKVLDVAGAMRKDVDGHSTVVLNV